jgi:nucleotide-binding universal stress UspA family protein
MTRTRPTTRRPTELEETMYQNVVVGCDGSAHGLAAARFGAWLARRLGSRLIVAGAYVQTAHVRTDGGGAERQARADAQDAAHAGVAAVAAITDARPLIVSGSSVAAALHDAARAEEADLLVVGTSERHRLAGTQPGSVTEHVLHHSPCPVAVVPPADREPTVRRLGVAVDDQPAALAALCAARSLAKRLGPELEELVLVHAELPDPVFLRPGMQMPAAASLATPAWLATVADGLAAPVPVRVVTDAGAAGKIVVERAHELDLLVMGSRDLGALRRVVLGSVATHVVRHAPCPVIVDAGHPTADTGQDTTTAAHSAI